MKVLACILLGGLEGADGYLDSAGMEALAAQLRAVPGIETSVWTWDKWEQALAVVRACEGHAKIAVIGYSGGGSRMTYLASESPLPIIDLMIGYDPSPKWQIKDIEMNVHKAICYYNTKPDLYVPLIGALGGGRLAGYTNIQTIEIAEPHLAVQADQSLHDRTIAAVKELLA